MPAVTPQAIQKKRDNWNKARRKTALKGRESAQTPGNTLLKNYAVVETVTAIKGDTRPFLFVLANPSETDRSKWIIDIVPCEELIGITQRCIKELKYHAEEAIREEEAEDEAKKAADALLLKRIPGFSGLVNKE